MRHLFIDPIGDFIATMRQNDAGLILQSETPYSCLKILISVYKKGPILAIHRLALLIWGKVGYIERAVGNCG